MSWLEFLAFVLTVIGIWLVGTADHKARNNGFLVGCFACVAWIVSAWTRGLFWYAATNIVLLGVYVRGWFRTRPFARGDRG